jgi:glycosyltransferase involved in cell wall biosynthesis
MPIGSKNFAVVVHSNLDYPGGAERCCINIIQVLANQFTRVLVIHSGIKTDINHISEWADIKFNDKNIKIENAIGSKILSNSNLSLLQYSFAIRTSFRYILKADLMFATFGEYSLNKTNVIQFIHFPIFFSDKDSLECLGVDVSKWHSRITRKVYVSLCRLISGWSLNAVEKNVTFTNSVWTAQKAKERYPLIHCQLAYPGVSLGGGSSEVDIGAFEQRRDAFVIVGRIVANKRIEDAIEIIAKVVKLKPWFKLYVVGVGEGKYFKKICDLASRFPFIEMMGRLSKSDLEMLILNVKYGIHCYRNEHYGIAPAEMQYLGCIVFVHNSGGQTEVVRDSRQRYLSNEDAFEKIFKVIISKDVQRELIISASDVNRQMTVKGFCDSIVTGLNK